MQPQIINANQIARVNQGKEPWSERVGERW